MRLSYSERIKKLCKLKRVPIYQLAEQLGMSEAGLHKTLKNDTLQVKKLQEIADFFSVNIMIFFTDEFDAGQTGSYLALEPHLVYQSTVEKRLKRLEDQVKEIQEKID